MLTYITYHLVEGKCEENWRHYGNYCYFFGNNEYSQKQAEDFCVQKSSHLTSLLDADEESFVVGNVF